MEDKKTAETAGEKGKGEQGLEDLLQRVREGDAESRARLTAFTKSMTEFLEEFWKLIIETGNTLIRELKPILDQLGQEAEKKPDKEKEL